MKSTQNKAIKLILILFIGIGTIFLLRYASLDVVKSYVSGFGNYSVFAYILFFSILPTFFFPVPVLALAAGVLFGVLPGTIYTVIGAIVNSSLMFFIARFTARDYFASFVNKKLSENMKKKLLMDSQTKLSTLFFILRLIPLVSYNVINYAAGITKISYWNYMWTTLVGIIPGTIAFLNFGDKSLNAGGSDFYLAFLLLVLLILGSSWGAKVYLKRTSDD